MELLYLLGKDVTVNVLSHSLTSDTVVKRPRPYVNVHLCIGGQTLQQLEDFITTDHDDYDDVIYLILHKSHIEEYQHSTRLKWLLSRVNNDTYHVVMCDGNMYDRLMHSYPSIDCLHLQGWIKWVSKAHTPFSRMSCDESWVGVDCFKPDNFRTNNEMVYHALERSDAITKMTVGLLSFHTPYATLQPKITIVNPELVVCREDSDELAKTFAFVYQSPECVVYSKRSISSLVNSYLQLKELSVIVRCSSYHQPSSNDAAWKLCHMLHDQLIPFTLQEAKQLAQYHPSKVLVLDENVTIPNWGVFVATLRKCLLLSQFDVMALHHPENSWFGQYGFHETFTTVHQENEFSIDTFGAYIVNDPYRVKHVITPLLAVCYFSTSGETVARNDVAPSYYAAALGDGDLASQMTLYACLAPNFTVVGDVLKQQTMFLEDAFQNVHITKGSKSPNRFEVAIHPTTYPFVFRSEVWLSAVKQMSWYQLTRPDVKHVGVHLAAPKAGMHLTQECGNEYYRRCVKQLEEYYTQTPIKLLLFLSHDHLDYAEEWRRMVSSRLEVEVVECPSLSSCNIISTIAMMGLCDALVLSTDEVAWWAGVLSRRSELTLCPETWINPNHWFYAQENQRKYHQPGWVKISNA